MMDSLTEYKSAWLRILLGIVGNDENAHRGMKLAELNGLFDPVVAVEAAIARAERLRLELEKIGWMDEFLDAQGAKWMMEIAREAVNADGDA